MMNALKMDLVRLDIQMKVLIHHIELGFQKTNSIVRIFTATHQFNSLQSLMVGQRI